VEPTRDRRIGKRVGRCHWQSNRHYNHCISCKPPRATKCKPTRQIVLCGPRGSSAAAGRRPIAGPRCGACSSSTSTCCHRLVSPPPPETSQSSRFLYLTTDNWSTHIQGLYRHLTWFLQDLLWSVFQDFPWPCMACRNTSLFNMVNATFVAQCYRTTYKLLCHFASNVSVVTNTNVLQITGRDQILHCLVIIHRDHQK